MDINIEDLVNKRDIMFSTKSVFQEIDIKNPDQKSDGIIELNENKKLPKKFKKLPKIQGNPVSLLCLNINSYMGGGSDVWRECRGNTEKKNLVNLINRKNRSGERVGHKFRKPEF